MYAKLFSQITESSLMDQPIEVRYVFLMLLPIADLKGEIVATNRAIARRINVGADIMERAIAVLSAPDPESSSQEHEGRRIIPLDNERGWLIVNYEKYRNLRHSEERREYMRKYMQMRRNKEKAELEGGKEGGATTHEHAVSLRKSFEEGNF